MADEISPITTRNGAFMGSRQNLAECGIVLLGAPLDGTASYLPGSRFAPASIRTVSTALETYSPVLDKDLTDVAYFDAGDVDFAFGNVSVALAGIKKATAAIVQQGRRPMVMGGEHLITLPVVEAVYAAHPDLRVLHFDAHADLRASYIGEKFSHATVFRYISELIGADRVFQFGIRSGSREEFAYGRANTRFFPHEVVAPMKSILAELAGHPLYISVDIDVVDPAFAPGTGTPEPGGVAAAELLQAMDMLAPFNVVGWDVVEVCPPVDCGVITSVLAAKVMREALLIMGSS